MLLQVETGPDLHEHLELIQAEIKLTPEQEQISHPKSELEHLCEKQKTYEITLNPSLSPIKFCLPLPHMTTEWGLGQLILKFTLKEVINVLILLLIEQSVLIIGHSHEEVSACTLALKTLLQPYTWPNVSITSLPEDKLDVVSSSFPYIIGIIARSKEIVTDIENDVRVRERMDDGLTVINLTSEKILWTTCKRINKYKLHCGHKIM